MRSTTLVAVIQMLLVLGASSTAGADKVRTKRLRIETTPPGAEVYLDDLSQRPIGITPVTANVPYGFHEIIVLLNGYETQRMKLNVDARTKKISVVLAQLGRMKITNVSEAALGARVLVDGREVGSVPYEGFVVPGRHQVTVTKDGHSTFSEWMELRSGELAAFTVDLSVQSSKTGTLFVAADVEGAEVRIDGQPRGKTPMSIELAAGPVLIEVRAKGLPPWSKTAEIGAGAKVIVQALVRPEERPTGTLLVIASVPGTLVEVDGVKTGTAPVTLSQIAPGTHVVEGVRKGYDRAQTTVKVVAGEQSVVKLDLAIARERFGTLAVRSSLPGAIVYVDGSSRGRAPVELSTMKLGDHAVVVRLVGYEDFTGVCTVVEHEPCRIVADLVALSKVRVVASPLKGRVSVDGKEVGEVPFEGMLPATTHVVRVEAKNYVPAEQTIQLIKSDELREIRFTLVPTETSTMAVASREAEAYARRKITYRGSTTYSAVPLGPGMNTIDFIVGAPYLLEIRGGVGILDDFAASVGIRLLERDTSIETAELVFRGHIGRRIVGAFSAGAQADVIGGTNFSGTATFGAAVRGLLTLHFGDFGAFTILVGGELLHDRPGDDGVDPQTVSRLFAGAKVTWWASESWGFFGGFDATVAGKDRLLYNELLFGAINEDPRVSIHLGATFAY